VIFNGTDITGLPPSIIAKMGLALVPQGRRVFQSLTVKENLTVAARSRGKGWSMDRIYSLFPVLKAREGQKAGRLSGGEQSMLSLARALRCEPDLLLMDEPSEGLAPLLVKGLRQVIQLLKEEQLSILLVEQNFKLALEVSDYVYVMNKGRHVYESTPEDLSHQEEVKTRYLGI
jgi:branched-chain amino acid transport system ATP-binding protein